MKTITSKQFEDECQSRILGHLWEDSFNADYQESITLTIGEMRQLVNLLREKEGLPANKVKEFAKDLE